MANAYITEAFKRLNVLEEDVFDVDDEGIQELKDFENDSDEYDDVDIIDPEAENEDELEDSYVGKVILDCCVCHSKIYKDKEEVHLSDDETIANADEECPYCYSTDGYKVIGEVAEFSKDEEEKEAEEEGEEEVEVKDEEEVVEESLEEDKGQDTADVLLDVIGSYGRQIDRSGKEYPTVVLDDIRKSVSAVLKRNGYTGRYAESVKNSRKAKSLKEGLKKRNLKESWGDVYEDLVYRAKSWIDDGYELDEAVNRALDDGLIYTSDIMELGFHYGVINDSQIISDMYEDLYSDIYGEVSDYYDEAHENDDEDVDESLKKKSCKGGKCKQVKEDLSYGELIFIEDRWIKWKKRNANADAYEFAEHFFKDEDGYTDRDREDVVSYVGILEDSVDESCKGRKCEEAVSKRDDIDAEADNKKERAKKAFVRAKDDADADRDYRLKRGITRKDEECRPRKKVKEDFNEVTITTDDTHMEMTSDEDGKVTVTTEPRHDDADTVVAPIEDETKVEIENNSIEDGKSDEEDEVEMDIDEFSTDEFDELGESFLKKSYNNVESYKTTGCVVKGNSLKVEGLITFKSGTAKKTHFVFESKDTSKRGKYRLIGENLQLSRGHKSFTIIGSINNKKFVSESLNYNYRASDANGKSQRVYGTVRVGKK